MGMFVVSCELVYIKGNNNKVTQAEQIEADLEVEVPKPKVLDAEIPK